MKRVLNDEQYQSGFFFIKKNHNCRSSHSHKSNDFQFTCNPKVRVKYTGGKITKKGSKVRDCTTFL